MSRSWVRNPPEKWNSARNYQLSDEESARGIKFRQELMAFEGGINGRNEISPEMSRSWVRNPPEKSNSARN
jgi:hypothetical protein